VATSLQDSGFVVALVNKKDATHRDYNSVFWFNICVSAFMYVVLFLCAPLIADFYNQPILVPLGRYYFLCFLIASFNIVPRAVLFRNLQQKELAIQGFVSLLLSGTIGVVMALNGMAYWGLATQTLSFNFFVVIMSWYLSKWRPSLDITFKPIREMFSFSSKMLITNICEKINGNIFSVVWGKFYDEDSVGNYGQANKWNLMGASTITGMVEGVAQPIFVQVGDDKERLCRTFRKMLRFTCFISCPVMFGLALIAPQFIMIFLEEKWINAAYMMQILCVGGAFLPISTLYYKLIISRGKSNIYMWNIMCQGLTILAFILLAYVLIEDQMAFSIFKLSMSFSVKEVMVLLYVVVIISWVGIWHIFLKREINLSFVDALKDISPFALLAAATMIITLLATSQITNLYLLLIARIIIAAVIYVGALWILGAEILKECLGYLLKKKPK